MTGSTLLKPLGNHLRRLAKASAPTFDWIEGKIYGNTGPKWPPLFVVGLPRCGTTLVYQSLCHAFDFSFLTSFSELFPPAPAITTWLTRRPSYISDFESTYGRSAGMSSPAEGLFWNLWFDRNRHYSDSDEISERAALAIVNTIGRMERIGGRPFLNKNLRNNQRIRVLSQLFPNAIFLVVLRSPIAVARSLLRGRVEKFGDIHAWLSVRPKNWEIQSRSPESEVASQILGLIDDLAADVEAIGAQRARVIHYEHFCLDPRGVLAGIERFLDQSEVPTKPMNLLPASFDRHAQGTVQTCAFDEDRLEAAVTQAFPKEWATLVPCSSVCCEYDARFG